MKGNVEEGSGLIDHAFFPHTHSSTYLMHKYWSRKPHNIVATYIAHFTAEDDVVLDPFGGSGVTANEALHLGRRSIHADVNPLATFIARTTARPIDVGVFESLAREVVERVTPAIQPLYQTACPSCGGTATITHAVWKDERDGNTARPWLYYVNCQCSPKTTIEKQPDAADARAISDIEQGAARARVLEDFPGLELHLAYPGGKHFMQLRHGLRNDPRLSMLFTSRNLIALHAIRKEIDRCTIGTNDCFKHDDPAGLRDAMLFLFSSMLPQASKMVWVIKKRAARSIKRLEVGSWTHHFFWNPTEFFEVNVLNGYHERLSKASRGFKEARTWADGTERWARREPGPGSAGCWWLEKVKTGTHPPPPGVGFKPRPFKEAASPADFFSSNRDAALFLQQDARHLQDIPDASIDYIFTDPPYGDSIQYMELSSFFLAWLACDLEDIIQQSIETEITINASQSKDITAYSRALDASFLECHRVLKDGKYMTVTFHNTDMRTRNALIKAIQNAGFIYKRAVYQPPPRPSEKSLLHKFGSPVGDYMITFRKESDGKRLLREIPPGDVKTVLHGVMDAIFSARNAPVPYNHLLSILDLELLSRGYIPPDTAATLNDFLELSGDYAWTDNEGWFFAPKAGEIQGHTKLDYEAIVKTWVQKFISYQQEREGNAQREAVLNASLARFTGILTPDIAFLKKLISERLPDD